MLLKFFTLKDWTHYLDIAFKFLSYTGGHPPCRRGTPPDRHSGRVSGTPPLQVTEQNIGPHRAAFLTQPCGMGRRPPPPLPGSYAIILPPKAKSVPSYLGEKRSLSPGGSEKSLGCRCTWSRQRSPSTCGGRRCRSLFIAMTTPTTCRVPVAFP